METGPNDARHVIWARSKFYFYSLFVLLLLMLLTSVYKLNTQRRVRKKGMVTKTGPNDARRVVWANSKSFFSFLLFFCY